MRHTGANSFRLQASETGNWRYPSGRISVKMLPLGLQGSALYGFCSMNLRSCRSVITSRQTADQREYGDGNPRTTPHPTTNQTMSQQWHL